MGLFSNKGSSEIIQGEIVKSKENNVIPEWSPVIVYIDGELSTYGNFYTNDVRESNDIDKIMKFSDNKKPFFKHRKALSSLRLRYAVDADLTHNVIFERIAYGTVASGITTKKEEKVDFAIQDVFSLQAILICGFCSTIPLFPNEIVGFRTENKSLKFICEQCSFDTGKKHYSIEEMLENDLLKMKKVKIVKNMKDFTPTTLLTDHDGMKRPQITKVLPIDRDTIKAGEKNDLRTASKNNTVIKGEESSSTEKEIESNNPEKERVEIMNTALNNPDVTATDRSSVSNEFDRTLESLNSINKHSTSVHEIFEEDNHRNSVMTKLEEVKQ